MSIGGRAQNKSLRTEMPPGSMSEKVTVCGCRKVVLKVVLAKVRAPP
jgi:hypothetical protein